MEVSKPALCPCYQLFIPCTYIHWYCLYWNKNSKTADWILWFLIVDPDLLHQEEVVVEEEEEEEEEEEDGEDGWTIFFRLQHILEEKEEKLWKWRLNIFSNHILLTWSDQWWKKNFCILKKLKMLQILGRVFFLAFQLYFCTCECIANKTK